MEIVERGVCRMSVVPVRQTPDHRSALVTQLLFGDHYSVLETTADGQWHRIRIEYDDYEGWMASNQHFRISEEYFDYLSKTEFKISTDLVASLLFRKELIFILIGSLLPISSTELFQIEEQLAFNGGSKNMGDKRDFEFLKEIALKYRNAPYLWGGKTPFGIDCSGFTQQVFKICGYRLHRDAWQQYQQGEAVQSLRQAIPGDLLFFNQEGGRIGHVGVLLEDLRLIHASGKVRIDTVDDEGLINHDKGIHSHHLVGIRRILRP
jgi:gamma-D-glutamyl-L-lysine dipeptidyl-peptidase